MKDTMRNIIVYLKLKIHLNIYIYTYIQMKNTPKCSFWILTHGAFNFNNSFNFSNFSNGVERKLVRLHLLTLNEIPKVVIFKVTIKFDQDAFTFWMPGP